MPKILLILILISIQAKGATYVDSLLKIYEDPKEELWDKLNVLHVLSGSYYKRVDLDSAEYYADQLFQMSQENGNLYFAIRGYNTKGIIAHLKNEYTKAFWKVKRIVAVNDVYNLYHSGSLTFLI